MTNADMLSKCKIKPIAYIDDMLIDHLEIDDGDNVMACFIDFDSVDANEWGKNRHGYFEVDGKKLIYYIDKLENVHNKEFWFLDFPELWTIEESKEYAINFSDDLYLILNLFHAYKFLYFQRNEVAFSLIEDEFSHVETKQIDETEAKEIISVAAGVCESSIYHEFYTKDGLLIEHDIASNLYYAIIFQLLKIISLAQKGIFDSIGICSNSACRSVFEMEHGNQRYCPKCRQGKNFDAMRKAECRKRMKARDAQNATKE